MPAVVYLIPTVLDPAGMHALPPAVLDAVRHCEVFFAENIRTARRYLKIVWPEMIIDQYEWHAIHQAEAQQQAQFTKSVKEGKAVGIISEAGCPGIADPGQLLVATAQQLGAQVKPITGPSSILLALMASGMNGQQFEFRGYLPIGEPERSRKIREMETDSLKKNSTQIFIETPYRNNQLLDSLLTTCKPHTRICVASALTGPDESIRTQTVEAWRKAKPELHKIPVIFLLMAG